MEKNSIKSSSLVGHPTGAYADAYSTTQLGGISAPPSRLDRMLVYRRGTPRD